MGVPRAWLAFTGAALLPAIAGSCTFQVDYGQSRYTCDDGVCPPGFICAQGICVAPGGDDTPDAAPPPAPDAPPGTPDATPPPPDASPPPPPDAASCNQGDTNIEDPESGHCYALFLDPASWAGARGACQAIGADLATIDSDMENAFVSALFTPGMADAWLGGTDAAQEMVWRWYDGRLVVYENWRVNEPNDGGTESGPEDCMVIELDVGGTWDDRPCTSSLPFVCER